MYTFCFTAERSLLHKILDVLLKDCWGPHRRCLGVEYGPQNRGWEPLVHMDWIDSHSRVDEGVTVGSCRINYLLFAGGLVLLASSQQSSACTRSVFCCMRPRRNEKLVLKIPRNYCMSLYKPKAVSATSERHYTAVCGDVQVPRGGIYVWRKAEAQEIDTRIGKANAVLRELIALWAQNGSFQTRQSCRFSNRSLFRSLPMVMNLVWWPKEFTQVQAPKLGFLRRVHGVTKWRTEVRLRPVQETSLAPPYLNLSVFGIKCPALKNNCDIVATFRRRQVIRRPRHCAPLVTPLVCHFDPKCAAVNFTVPWMSNHF